MECLILRYRSNSQTSNKLNTIAIPLAATSLCMVANIVLALSFGEVMFRLSGNLVGISINLCKSIQKELFINDTP